MLVVDHVSKRYGHLRALDDVSASFFPGEIHAVLGENGAGKSTLVGVVSGFVSPSAGQISLDGNLVPVGKPFECKRAGIEMIHQHFTLVSEFTVAENFALANISGLAKALDVQTFSLPALEVAARLNWPVDPSAKIKTLPVGVQQRIEILKALAGNARVLVFDEPTAVLAPDEVRDLFRVLRQLKDDGCIVILIAHKLSEVMSVADRVTVLRRGKFVATAEIGAVNAQQLAEWMVGEFPIVPPVSLSNESMEPGLEIKNLTVLGDRGENSVLQVSFQVAHGEILGIGGVDGNGQIELAEALARVRPVLEGTIRWEGSEIPSDFVVGYIPQDRQRDGLALSLSIQDNDLISGRAKRDLRNGPFFRLAKVKKWAQDLIQRFSIKASGPGEIVSRLSGGNQQKVVVSRTLDQVPSVLVAISPTRGLDIKATEFVHAQIRAAKNSGCAIILISTDLDELAALAHRTIFMSRGKFVEGDSALNLVGGAA